MTFSQFSGILSGTSGCGDFEKIELAAAYIDVNQEQIAIDMSRGRGETLDNLLVLIGIDKKDRTMTSSFLKSNFSQIYYEKTMTGKKVAKAIFSMLEKDEYLNKYTG